MTRKSLQEFPPFIIIIRHELRVDRPVSASSYSLFKRLPSRPRPFALQFSIIFGILLLFVLVARRVNNYYIKKFNLYKA